MKRRRRTPPKGYQFTNDDFAWYWRPTPHYHLNESEFGDPDGRCFTSLETAKRELWRLFQRNYDVEQAVSYTHYVQDDQITISYPENHNPDEITLSVDCCDTPDDCYMVDEEEETR